MIAITVTNVIVVDFFSNRHFGSHCQVCWERYRRYRARRPRIGRKHGVSSGPLVPELQSGECNEAIAAANVVHGPLDVPVECLFQRILVPAGIIMCVLSAGY